MRYAESKYPEGATQQESDFAAQTRHLPAPRVNSVRLHVREDQLETIAQRPHVWIHVFLQLECVRYDFDEPMLYLCVLAGFEAEIEVACVFGIDTEVVDASFGVGLGVGGQPAFY